MGRARNFDTTFSAFAAGDRIIYAGSNGERRVNVALAAGPESDWHVERRGPSTGGARTAAAAVPHGRGAAVFSTFGPGDVGAVYLVRQTGDDEARLDPARVRKGHIRAVSVAVNTAGDVLVAWDRNGTIESRMWIGRSQRFTAVQALGTVTAAAHLSVALGADRRAVVAWIDQRVSEGNTGQKATVMATARSGSRGFLLPAKQLEAYPDTTIPGGTGIQAAYTSGGRGVIAWSGRTAVRASLVDGRLIRAPQDLAPVAPDETGDTAASATSRSHPRAPPWSRWSPRSTRPATSSSPRRSRTAPRRSARPRPCPAGDLPARADRRLRPHRPRLRRLAGPTPPRPAEPHRIATHRQL